MRQQLVYSQVFSHLEHIRLHEAYDSLLSTSKESGAYGFLRTTTNRFKDHFGDQILDNITNRDLSLWVDFERKRGIKDQTLRLWCQ